MQRLASLFTQISRTFATKLQASSTRNNKDSAGKRLGVKKFTGEYVYPNDIVVRQRGFKWKAGLNTHYGLDHTIHASREGLIKFTKRYKNKRKITTIHVVPTQAANTKFTRVPPFLYHPELYPNLAKFNAPPANLPTYVPPVKLPRTQSADYPVISATPAYAFAISVPANWQASHKALVSRIANGDQVMTEGRIIDARNREIREFINRQ